MNVLRTLLLAFGIAAVAAAHAGTVVGANFNGGSLASTNGTGTFAASATPAYVAGTTGLSTDKALSLLNNASTGSYLDITFSTVGLKGLGLSYDVQQVGSAAFYQGVLYAVGSGAFTLLSPYNTAPTNGTYGARAFDLTSVTALNNQASVTLRLGLYSSTTQSGAAQHLDNVVVSAQPVPEPASLAALGLGALGLLRRKRASA